MNLVFASGFLFPQNLLGIDYFRGLKGHLEGKHAAIFPLVPPTETRQKRARALADAIQKAYPEGPVHIIAHSMGGLDSRTLIAANYDSLSDPGRIASLSTLSTPHRGSPVADLLVGPKPDGPRRVTYETIRQVLDALGIPTGAFADLTTHGASQVPDTTQTHPHIRYFSYLAAGRPGSRPTCIPFLPTYHYLDEVTGQANDGMVPLDSARYGEIQEPTWQCDHVDMVGHNLDPFHLGGFRFDHFAAIDGVISKL